MSAKQKIIDAMAGVLMNQSSYTLNDMADAVIKALEPSYSSKISRVAIEDQEIPGETVPGDTSRLLGLQVRVEAFMSNGQYHVLSEIAEAVGGLPTSVSARLRQAEASGRWRKHKRNLGRGLWSYRLLPVTIISCTPAPSAKAL